MFPPGGVLHSSRWKEERPTERWGGTAKEQEEQTDG